MEGSVMKEQTPTLEETLEMCKKHCDSKIDVYRRANVDSVYVIECEGHRKNIQTLLNSIRE